MEREHHFYVYILASRSRTLYIGVTGNLEKRVLEHRTARNGSFTAKYNITRLVYFEHFQSVQQAITREKHLKHWTRAEKLALIAANNPTWQDLAINLTPSF